MVEEMLNKENLQQPGQNGMELATPEQRNELQRGLIDVSARNGALNSMKIINKRKLNEIKSNFVKDLLTEMEKSGVDLNNQESISEFLDKLGEQSPDLRELFETAFGELTGGDENSVQEEQPPINNVNNNVQNDQNIQQAI